MTPKEKANELFDKYFFATFGDSIQRKIGAKQCALIAVEQVLESIPSDVSMEGYGSAKFENPDIKFWQEVKQEIEKL